MWCNISKLVVAVILVLLVVGCPSKDSSPGSEELRLLTPEQEKKLFEDAERVEKKEIVRQSFKNDKGEVVGTVTSQTTVIFLKGGGRFNVNTTCAGACSGNPTLLCTDKDDNTCGCRLENNACECKGCSNKLGCTGTCAKSSVGFGNFGRFIAMDRGNTLNTTVAHK